ncbi:hypothetical protein [Phaffia rhodozyma]|uniref:HAM1-like N-terminal domain-containing protein n=1 Tax=Phaffia rhodozyma TaxID=264483 RepID=A0A0F7SG25_PHARH|nr:hypothetical protein [Phaffia rhodozyma]
MSTERSPLLPTHLQPNQQTVDQAKDQARKASFKIATAIAAFQAGKLPSQSQLNALLAKALDSDLLSPGIGRGGGRTGRLSEEGSRVVRALRDVVSAIGVVGNEKNGDDKIQNFLYHVTQIEAPSPVRQGLDASTSTLVNNREAAKAKRELSKDADKAVNSLQQIGSLFLTSGQFRLVLNQVISLFASIVADASGAVAEQASELEKQARETGDDNTPIDLEAQKKKGKKVAKGLASGRLQGKAQEQLGAQFEGLAEYFEDKLTGDQEVKDKLFEKLNAVVKDIQSKPEYQQAIDTILGLIKKYFAKAEQLVDQASQKASEEADQEPLQQSLGEGKLILETFASGESFDPVLDSAKTLKKDVENDREISDYFSEIGRFLEASLKVEGYVTSQRAYRRSSDLWQRGQDLAQGNEQYKKDISEFLEHLENFFGAVADDDAMVDLAFKIENLITEVEHAGKTGANALRAESLGLWRDLVDVVLPRAIALVKEIPVPRTEFKSEAVDLVIDDVSFESASFIPDNIRIINHNDFRASQGYAAFAADYDTSVKLHVDGLKFHAKDISYWVNKKSGFPTFEDEGLLEIAFDNKGIAFDVTLENAGEDDREQFFIVKDVDVDISDFTYSISKNSSWLLYFSRPFVSGLLRKNLKASLEHQITEYLKDADFRLYGLQQRAIAATNARPSPSNYLKAIFSDSLLSSYGTSTKVTQKGVVKYGRKGEFLLAIGVDEQLFPGKAGPSNAHSKRHGLYNQAVSALQTGGGIDAATAQINGLKIDAQREVNKASLHAKKEHREEAGKEGWRSEAFDV